MYLHGINALGQTDDGGSTLVKDISGAIVSLGTALAQVRSQSDLIKLNQQLVAQGKAPISLDQVTPGVNVGVSSDTRTLLYVALGAAAVIAILWLMRHKL